MRAEECLRFRFRSIPVCADAVSGRWDVRSMSLDGTTTSNIDACSAQGSMAFASSGLCTSFAGCAPAPPIFPTPASLLLPAPLNTTIDQNPSRPARAVGTASGARLVGHAEPGVIGGYAVPGGQRRAGGCDEGGDYQTGQRREESSSHGRAVNGVDERNGCSTLCGTGLRLQWRRSSDRREVRLIIP